MKSSNHHQCCGTQEGSVCWFNADICGLIPFELGECVLFYGLYFVSKHIIFSVIENTFLKVILFTILIFLYSMAVISHMRCCFTDPGSVPSNAVYLPEANEDEKLLFCVKCNSYKPPRAHHCSQCNRCIVRMDHHCPWINNCIGYRNMKYFVLFLVYVMAMCVFTALMDCYRLYYSYCHIEDEPIPVIVGTMATLTLAILFFIFTGNMYLDAMSSIRTNTTVVAIDRLKGVSYSGSHNAFGDYFGDNGKFNLTWLLPINPRYKDLEGVRGYCIRSLDV